jgi:hypothetical protein
MYMRGASPIPNNVIQNLYAKADVASKSSRRSYNSLEDDDSHANNTINITYTTAPSIAQTPKSEVHAPQVPTTKKEETKADVDENLPTTNVNNANTFAVIIANEHYQDVAEVPYASNDGAIFAEYCKKSLGLPATNVHLVKNATLNNMKREINWLKQVSDAYKEMLKEAGISEKRIPAVLRVADLSGVKLDEDGNIKDKDKLVESVKEEWSDFIQAKGAKGADTKTPPDNNGGTLTKDDILKIKDAGERQQKIAENHELFGF